jgi:protein OS-9
VLRWGEGTVCDKTGRRRDAEIQFHCGMAGPDTVLFIKETRTCSYVLVVHTPRICSLPGFRAPDADAQAEIKCRQVVDALPPKGDLSLLAGEEPAPAALPKKKSPVLASTQGTEDKKAGKQDKKAFGSLSKEQADLFSKLEKILGYGDGEDGIVLQPLGDGTYALEIPEDLLDGNWMNGDYDNPEGTAEGYGFAQGDEIELDEDLSAKMFDILKAAGYDVKGAATKDKKDKKKDKKDRKEEEED